MNNALPRRWVPRYSLRGLFVGVTVIVCWLGWELKIVRDRRAMRLHIEELGGWVDPWTHDPAFLTTKHPRDEPWREKWAHVSQLRWRLGDEPLYYINLVHSDATWAEREQVSQLFPEAFLVPESSNGLQGRGKPKARQYLSD